MYDDDEEEIVLTIREYRALVERLDVLEERDDEQEAELASLRTRLGALEMRGSGD